MYGTPVISALGKLMLEKEVGRRGEGRGGRERERICREMGGQGGKF